MPFTAYDTPIGGPAYFNYNSGTIIQPALDWTVEPMIETGEIVSNLQDLLDLRDSVIGFQIKFTPLAVWGNIGVFFPYTADNIGAGVRPSSDHSLVIQTKAGATITFPAVVITECPKLTFSANPKSKLFGTMTFTALLAQATLPSTAASYFTVGANAYAVPNLDPTTVRCPRFLVQWGDTPAGNFADIQTESGVEFDVKLKLTPIETDSLGLINYRVEGVRPMIDLTPVNLTEADLFNTFLEPQGTGHGKGTSRPTGLFTCTGQATGDPILTVAHAAALNGSLRFGKTGRVGKLSLQPVRRATANVLDAQYALTTAS